MADHLLHIEHVDDGYPVWRFECVHAADDERWFYRDEDGSISLHHDGRPIGGCWLESWWDGVGGELFDSDTPITSLPVAVKPDGWDYWDGGRIIPEDGA